ncbi:MAG TPA: SpoIID/LytB domain-containing protein [Ardenticatenaceae bacterium]
MKLFALPTLLLIAAAIAWPLRAIPTTSISSEGGAERLTTGADLFALDSWDAATGILAYQVAEEEPRWLGVDAEAGTLAAAEAPMRAAEVERVTVEVDGMWHRLLLDGEVLWETEEEIVGRPTLSPDGSWLVVTRYPHGSSTAPLGELWRYDIAAKRWTPLTRNDVEEMTPVISPDGEEVGFLRFGDVWVVPSNQTTTETLLPPEPEFAPLAVESLTPPATIRVAHHKDNTCRRVPEGHVTELSFEEYIKRVVPHEISATSHPEVLKAQAVAARTYAWYKVLYSPRNPNYEVTDWTIDQYMCDTTDSRTDAAVEATAGEHMTQNNKIILTMFSAENASPTKQNPYGVQYLNPVNDPVGFGIRRYGHGMGFSQRAGRRWAELGWSYKDILLHYYTGTQLWAPDASKKSLGVRNRPTTTHLRDPNDATVPAAAYLRGSGLWLDLNANNVDGTRAREWRPDGSGNLVPGEWQEDHDVSNGWSHLFPLLHLPDITARNYRIELDTIPNWQPDGQSVMYLGIDRTAPALDTSISVGEGEGAVPAQLSLNYSDATSGMERVGWSMGSWQVEAEHVNAGWNAFDDPYASGGRAVRLNQGDAATVLSFPAISMEPGLYRVWFRLFTNGPLTSTPIATLRVYDDQAPRVLRGLRQLRAPDFVSAGWEWFYVDVDTTLNYDASKPGDIGNGHDAHSITAEIDWPGQQVLEIDRVLVATRQPPLVNSADLTVTPPESVMVYASDHAGNATFARCGPAWGAASETQEAESGAQSEAVAADWSNGVFLPLVSGPPIIPAYQCGPE